MTKIFLITGMILATVLVRGQYTNVTLEALGNDPAQVQGKESVAWPDVNNDGWPDLFICSQYLYINQHDGTFLLQDPNENGFGFMGGTWFSRATFADVDNDGDLDCIQSGYYDYNTYYFENSGAPDFHFEASTIYPHEYAVCGGQPTFFNADDDIEYEAYLSMLGNWNPYAIGKDRLFDFVDNEWVDVTAAKIPELETSNFRRPSRGNVACDYDNDKDIDVYVTNYGISTTENHLNFLWNNDSEGNFIDVAGQAGVAIEPNSGYEGLASGASWGDFNNDGYFDLAVANIHGIAALYLNHQDGTFTNEGAGLGIPNWSFEWHNTLFLDYDNDGDMDLFYNQWYNGKNALLFRNDGPENLGHFSEVTYFLGFAPMSDLNFVTGWATADYDKDGDLDIAFYNASDNYAGFYLWRNDTENENHWLVAKMIGNGTTVNQNAIGTRARIMFSDTTWSPIMQVESSSADQGMNMHPIHFGLGLHETYAYMKVEWPDGAEEYFLPGQFENPTDAWVDIVQGTGYLTPVEQHIDDDEVQVVTNGKKLSIIATGSITEINIIDLNGKQIYPTELRSTSSTIDMELPTKGMYIISGSHKGRSFVKKVLVQ